jgi:hypothetical protein
VLWDDAIKGSFKQTYRNTSFCGRLFFTYSNPFIASINANKGEMKLEMAEDLNEAEGETTKMVARFTADLNRRIKQYFIDHKMSD